MPLKLEVKRKLNARSSRVKSLDFHPTEPWLLCSLYNGQVYIWNYKTEVLVKSFEINELPVRCARFVPRKQWIITASDDNLIRVYNYNTMAKIKTFEAHSDYVRNLAVHPTQPYLLSASDDMTIKLWDWEKGWKCTQMYEGHSHYVMMVCFNPKDANTFASASLDRTIKVWSLQSTVPNFTLEGHERGVNSISYFSGGDKPYLVSGADDRTIKIWDYLNKSCVQTLEGHSHNVSTVVFHPTLPILISGSEDSTVKIWNLNTYRLEKTLNYGMDRVWALACVPGSSGVAIGYDEGTIMVKFGREEPALSMDQNGKIIWARQSEIQQVNVKAVKDVEDGERITTPTKDLGTSEIYPQALKHSPNGRFVVVCGDGEYIIYTALAWRNKSFGKGLECCWGPDTGEYGVRESASKVKLFKNFKEKHTLRPVFSAEGIFGGNLLAVRSSSFVCFYDWNECAVIRRIDVVPKAIYWNDSGELVVISCDQSFYILRFNANAVVEALDQGEVDPEEGIEAAFEVLHEVSERVRSGLWVGDCFIYTSAGNRLNYCVGSEVVTVAHLDRTMYPLGYLSKQNRVYLADKSLNVISYAIDLSVINYQTAILREDMEAAEAILAKVPEHQHNRIAQFLEAQGLKEMALEVATDPDLKFELAIQLNKLMTAYKLAAEADSDAKWKQLGDIALSNSEFGLARDCMNRGQDFAGLLALLSSIGDAKGLIDLAGNAKAEGLNNIAFVAWFITNQLDQCVQLLCETNRFPEAAFLARTYRPSLVEQVLPLWKEDLRKTNPKAADALADPKEYPNLFPDHDVALKAEKLLALRKPRPASAYPQSKGDASRDLVAEIKAGNVPPKLIAAIEAELAGGPPAVRPASPAAGSPATARATSPAPSPAPATASVSPKASPAPVAKVATPEPTPQQTAEPTPELAPGPATPDPEPEPASAPEDIISFDEASPVSEDLLSLDIPVSPEPAAAAVGDLLSMGAPSSPAGPTSDLLNLDSPAADVDLDDLLNESIDEMGFGDENVSIDDLDL